MASETIYVSDEITYPEWRQWSHSSAIRLDMGARCINGAGQEVLLPSDIIFQISDGKMVGWMYLFWIMGRRVSDEDDPLSFRRRIPEYLKESFAPGRLDSRHTG